MKKYQCIHHLRNSQIIQYIGEEVGEVHTITPRNEKLYEACADLKKIGFVFFQCLYLKGDEKKSLVILVYNPRLSFYVRVELSWNPELASELRRIKTLWENSLLFIDKVLEENTIIGIASEYSSQDLTISHRHYMPLSPFHNSSFEFDLWLKDDVIVKNQITLGGNEKKIEENLKGKMIEQALSEVSLLNLNFPVTLKVLFAHAVESITNISLTDREISTRMILLELERIQSHLFTLYRSFSRGSFAYGETYVVHLLSDVQNFMKGLDQQISIGGENNTIGDEWIYSCWKVVEKLRRDFVGLKKVLKTLEDLETDGEEVLVNCYEAESYGITGPVLKSMGVKRDLRKDRPYFFYSDCTFDIALAINGDSKSRLQVRLDEINQSTDIILQILEYFPAETQHNIEQSSEEGAKVRGMHSSGYVAIEAPYGELGLDLEIEEGKVKSLFFNRPSWHQIQLFPRVVNQIPANSLQWAIATFDILDGDLDL